MSAGNPLILLGEPGGEGKGANKTREPGKEEAEGEKPRKNTG